MSGWTPVTEDTLSMWKPVEEKVSPHKAVPNARIRNLPNPAEGMTPGRALYEGAKTGLTAGSLGAAAASPLSAARALISGTAGSVAGQSLAKAGGAGEFGQEVAGDVGGLVAGAGTEGLFQSGKSTLASKLFTSEGDLTELGKSLAHPAEKGGEYALRRMFGFDPDAIAQHKEFAENLADIEKARQKELSQFGRLRTMDEKQQAKDLKGNVTPFEGAPKNPSGKIVTPDSPVPEVKTTYQSYNGEDLYRMASKGDLNAIMELMRNPRGYSLPPNTKFLLEEATRMPWRNYNK